MHAIKYITPRFNYSYQDLSLVQKYTVVGIFAFYQNNYHIFICKLLEQKKKRPDRTCIEVVRLNLKSTIYLRI